MPPPEDLFAGLGPWANGTRELVARYFDTADLRLLRAGITARHRSDDGWTVKLPEGHDGDALVRDEITIAGPAGPPPVPVADLVTAWSRGAPLVEVARLTTQRRRTVLRDAAGGTRLELVDDVVDGAPTAGGAAVTFHEIEIEASDAAGRDAAERVAQRLVALGATAGGPRPKVARVLGVAADAPADVEVEPLTRGARVDATVRAAIAASVRKLMEHDPGVRRGDDPEALHQMRVATRRLRSDLSTFRPVLDRSWTEPLRDELAVLGTALGRVRDTDVVGARLATLARTVPGVEPRTLAALTDLVTASAAAARADLLALLRSRRYTDLLEDLVEAADAPPVIRHAGRRARTALVPLARRSWRRLDRFVGRLHGTPTDADLHEVRKRAKRARYACEAVGPVAPKRVRRAARRLAALQDLLGDHHDAVVLAERLRAVGVGASDPSVAFLAGELAAACRSDAARRRAAWPGTWHSVRHTVRAAFA